MRVKLDENFGVRGAALLEAAGFDVATVAGQGLSSAADSRVADVCRSEGRTLISLDLDFANTLRFKPAEYCGLVVLRLPEPLSLSSIESALRRVIDLASEREVTGRLWIVDGWRIREFIEPDGV